MDSALQAYEEGYGLIRPYLYLEGLEGPLPPDATLERGIAMLEEATDDSFWEANWLLGKAYEALRDNEKSASWFGKAYRHQPERREVVHEYVISLLRVNNFPEAIAVSETSDANDPMLVFDRALALFAAGDSAKAIRILEDFDWPGEFKDRVSELSRRLRTSE